METELDVIVSDGSDLDTSGFARPSVKVGLPLNK
jgi:hypothetical protein